MSNNPYSLMFGTEPTQSIPRIAQSVSIVDDFMSDNPSQQVYMITGVRGAGKTVFLTELSHRFAKEKDWVVVNINPERDIMEGLGAKLVNDRSVKDIIKGASINLSFFGFGIGFTSGEKITDIEIALMRMLESLKKKKKKVLVAIDEVSNSKEMRIFASSFQIFVREKLPIFLLMTGLYENIDDIQNVKTLTFLHRAPKLTLASLNRGAIVSNYKKTFKLSDEDAHEMAGITLGYPFAFQVLGHLTWENNGNFRDVIDEYRQYLEDYVYDKLWSELSEKDRYIAFGIAKSQSGKIADIRDIISLETNEFNPYRKRLLKKGIINGDRRGYVSFTLPYFSEFVLDNYM